MHLRYKTEAYLIMWIRRARIAQTSADEWLASLPEFGIEATGETEGDAEDHLLIRLMFEVFSNPQHLPPIDNIELTPDDIVHESRAGVTGTEIRDSEQAWFWTPEWQAGEQEASEDIAAGRVEVFDSADAFLASFPD